MLQSKWVTKSDTTEPLKNNTSYKCLNCTIYTNLKSLHCTPETKIMFAKLFGSKRKIILKQNEIDDQFVMEGDIVGGPMGFWPPSTLWT